MWSRSLITYGRAALLAILLGVPLVHGAGAHLRDVTDAAPSAAAPTEAADLHAADGGCSLCVSGRGAGDRLDRNAWSPLVPPQGFVLTSAPADRATLSVRDRPDAARAPPHRSV